MSSLRPKSSKLPIALSRPIDRRCVVATLGGALVFAGCSGDSSSLDAGDGGDDASDDATDDTSDAPDCSTAGKDLGPATTFPVGKWKLVGSYIVAQDANGYFAFSAICTHQGCLVDAPSSNGATFCPCHGSRFDGNGAVTSGPANRPLQHYALSLCGSDLVLDPATPVSAATRTPAQ